MNFLRYIECYQSAFAQLRESWMKITAWTVLWQFVGMLFLLGIQSSAERSQMMIALGIADNSFVQWIGGGALTLLTLAFVAIQLYSQCGVVYETGRAPNTGWLECGIQGIRHPLRALRVFLAIMALAAVFYIASAVLVIVGGLFGKLIIPIVIFIYLVTFFFLFWAAFACFCSLDDEYIGGFGALKQAVQMSKGYRIGISLMLFPILIASGICVISSEACLSRYQERSQIEYQMALEAIRMIEKTADSDSETLYQAKRVGWTAMEQRRMQRVLKTQEIYSKPIPEYDGDLDDYIERMAEYGNARAVFEARREQTGVSDLVKAYQDRPGTSSKRWVFGAFIIQIINFLLIALMYTVLFAFYRQRENVFGAFQDVPVEKVDKKKTTNAPENNAQVHQSAVMNEVVPSQEQVNEDKRPDFVEFDVAGGFHIDVPAETPENKENAQAEFPSFSKFGAAQAQNEVAAENSLQSSWKNKYKTAPVEHESVNGLSSIPGVPGAAFANAGASQNQQSMSGISQHSLSGVSQQSLSGISQHSLSGVSQQSLSGISQHSLSGVSQQSLCGSSRSSLSPIAEPTLTPLSEPSLAAISQAGGIAADSDVLGRSTLDFTSDSPSRRRRAMNVMSFDENEMEPASVQTGVKPDSVDDLPSLSHARATRRQPEHNIDDMYDLPSIQMLGNEDSRARKKTVAASQLDLMPLVKESSIFRGVK